MAIYYGGSNGYCGWLINHEQWLTKVKVTYSDLKMLETIITDALFSILVYFYENLQFTGQQWKGEAIFLMPHGGKAFLDKEVMGRVL